jgi:hypothetical protein
MGGVSRQTYSATLPPDRFFCLLDELPMHLVPRCVLKAIEQRYSGVLLYLNPECRIFSAPQVPAELAWRRDLISGLAMQGAIAWVRDPGGELPLPFWLGTELEPLVKSLNPNEPVGSAFPCGARSILCQAGILVPPEPASAARVMHADALARAGRMFREKGYAPLHGLIHPFHIAALRRYYRHRIRTGAIQLGDGQSARRYVVHNDPVARFFHQQIARTLSLVAGEPVKPSYVYLASYLAGADLKKHIDREQCEFSISLCLDFSPEPELASPWPISFDTAGGTVTVYQALGDGVAYRGTRLPHYRSKLGEGQTSTSIFFHYVAADFAGCLD